MNVIEEFSRLILVVLIAILLLQIITKGNGTNWITSKFSNTGGNSISSPGIQDTTAGRGNSGFGPGGSAGQGSAGGGGGSF